MRLVRTDLQASLGESGRREQRRRRGFGHHRNRDRRLRRCSHRAGGTGGGYRQGRVPVPPRAVRTGREVVSTMSNVASRQVILRPGVRMPDWSAITRSAAREALTALYEVLDWDNKLGGISPGEDCVWRAAVDQFVESGAGPVLDRIMRATGLSRDELDAAVARLAQRDVL